MPKPEPSISKSFGEHLSFFIGGITGWTEAQFADFPEAFDEWLDTHNFVRRGVPDPDRNGRNQINYAGFGSWARTSILALGFGVILFELYAMLLGHASQDAETFAYA